jgi:hypothetical protein
MGLPPFEASVSGLGRADVASLTAQLRRAAILADTRQDRGTVTVRSRRNSIFSAEDVLEVFEEWLGQDPARAHSAVVRLDRRTRPDLLRRVSARPAPE